VITVLLIIALVFADAIVAIATGLIGRARRRRFWLWALLGLFFPFVALVVVIVLPRRRR
jgi:hypothetical protein